MTSRKFLAVAALFADALALGQSPKPYPLMNWDVERCLTKGRFQDQEYVRSAIMDRIVADGKAAIPVLISQITDSRLVGSADRQVLCYNWAQFSVGQLAHFILRNLFSTWAESTMPPLFSDEKCSRDTPGFQCWSEFQQRHSFREIQLHWAKFWTANESRIYWDPTDRCFRLSARTATK